MANLTFDVSAHTSIYGLGYSFVEIREHSIGMDARLWVMATPVDGKHIVMSLGSQVRELRKPTAADRRFAVPPAETARSCHEPVHIGPAVSGCSAGCGHLAEQAVPIPPAPLPFRR